ncbi:MAG: class I SAM-dependent methyltransferase [Candidatus Promineifilaceae bacterium]
MITAKVKDTCPVCELADVVEFVQILQVPAHCNLLYPQRAAAIAAPSGDIHLGYCRNCDHVFNRTFDPSLMVYTQDYENSLHFSPRFQSYAKGLVEKLVNRYNLRGKDVIDIGAGKGDFLIMLCEAGENRGIGFDPSYVPGPEAEAENVTFVQDFYSKKYTSYAADFIACRHVLEHIETPRDFVASVRSAVGGRTETIVFFEVPNVLYTLRDMGIWDIIYEHCSFFSPHSLSYLFQESGFEVLDVTAVFGGQFLTIESQLASETAEPDSHDSIAPLVDAFAESYNHKVASWQQQLGQIVADGRKAVVWGAGSKGVTFLNILKSKDMISYVVDINPRKGGMFVAGTGQQIVPPEFLKEYRPDVVVIMNGNYQDEIQKTLEEMGLESEILLA